MTKQESNRRYRERHPDTHREATNRWRVTPEGKQSRKEESRRYKEKHSEAIKARKRKESKIRHTYRKEMLDILKLECGCKKCGYKDHPAALHFHHRDPSEKKTIVSIAKHHNIKVLQDEIDKCDILCANCHSVLEHS